MTTTASAKAKGRKLQQKVRDTIVSLHPSIQADDVKSTAMGQGGEDVQLSPFARSFLPISIECKKHKSFAVYKYYEQACVNGSEFEPVLVIEADRKKPLVVVDMEHYFNMWKELLNE